MENINGLTLIPVKEKDRPTDTFEIEVRWMHGDADHYTSESLFGNRAKLDGFYEFVEAWYAMKHNARIDMLRKGRPTQLPGWWVFVYVDSKEEYENDKHPDWFDDCWPIDVTCDWYPARLDGFSVFYYDDVGRKYSVERE